MSDDIMDFNFEGDNGEEDLGIEEPKFEQFVSNVLNPKLVGRMNPSDAHGALRILTFKVEADKDYLAKSTFSLCKLPQGIIRVMGALSYINFGVSGTLGWSKFRKRNGSQVDTDLKGFGKVKKGMASFLTHLDTQTLRFDSIGGIDVACTASKAGKKGDSIEGSLVYVKQ